MAVYIDCHFFKGILSLAKESSIILLMSLDFLVYNRLNACSGLEKTPTQSSGTSRFYAWASNFL